MEDLPDFPRSQAREEIAQHTAQAVAEAREAIRASQQTIEETYELLRRLDVLIDAERKSFQRR